MNTAKLSNWLSYNMDIDRSLGVFLIIASISLGSVGFYQFMTTPIPTEISSLYPPPWSIISVFTLVIATFLGCGIRLVLRSKN